MLCVRALYGAPRLGYDETWALLWGSQVFAGTLPEMTAPFAPTPHPLTIAIGALLAPIGDRALDVYAWLGPVSLVALGAAAWAAGAALFGRLAGAVAALLLLTSPLLVAESLYASADVPFLALVLAAVAAAAHGGRPGRAVFALLALAGLLRPEAWLLSAGAAAWRLAAERRVGPGVLAAAAAAPIAWALVDLAATGDPLHSLHGTQGLAETLERPRDPLRAVGLVPHGLGALLGPGAAVTGLVGGLVAAWRVPGRAALPLATAGLGVLTFVGLGLAALPVLLRYLVLAAAALALLAGYGLTAWTAEPRRGAVVIAVVLLGLLAADAPHAARSLRAAAASAETTRLVREDLRALVRSPAIGRAGCGPILVPGYRPVPLVRLLTGAPVSVGPAGAAPARVIVPTSAAAASTVALAGPDGDQIRALAAPAGFAAVTASRSWALLERCRRPADDLPGAA